MTSLDHLRAEVNKEASFWQNVGDAFKGAHKVFMIIGTVLLTGCLICLGVVISKQIKQEERAQKYQEFRETNLKNQNVGLQMLRDLKVEMDSIRFDQVRWHYEGKVISTERSSQLNKIEDAITPSQKMNGLYKIKKQ
jgi:hypothetical protein